MRVQVLDRARINARPGNPRHALRNESRGRLLDARGTPLAVSKGNRRMYPAGRSLAQTVGYASSLYGESGLESAFDSVLSPEIAAAQNGTTLSAVLGADRLDATSRGGDVVLTLRGDIAGLVDRAMPGGVRGAAIVLDPRTGAILAAVNRPTFDPNKLAEIWRTLHERADAPLLNRSFDGLYPPGSTFKIVTASAALDTDTVAAGDVFDDPGYFSIGGYTVHNAEHEATGNQTVARAFALSSNVDFAQIGLRLGVDRFYDYLRRFHVGDDSGVAFSTTRDDVPKAATISQSELAQMAFGQGLAVTPLRMALVASAIAEGGLMMRPQLVKELRPPRGPLLQVPAEPWGRVSSKDTAATVHEMMLAVVRNGTGTAAQVPAFAVAGKTGTGTHPGGAPDAWFVCYAPAQAPRLAVAIVVEDAGYGGVVAAPIARTILTGALPLYSH